MKTATFRKKKTPIKRQLGCYLDPRLHNAIVDKCKRKNISLSEIIRLLLTEWSAGEITIKKTLNV